VPDRSGGDARRPAALFALLHAGGHVPGVLAETLGRMAGFRNVLVHGYDTVDVGIVRDVLEHRLGDLLAFTAAIRARL
jgi:uncharacterized protein YutE (UPF0331/DUF86 family)